MIALIEPPMIGVMEPFLNGQKAALRPAPNQRFSPPFKVPFSVDFQSAIFDGFRVFPKLMNLLDFAFAMR